MLAPIDFDLPDSITAIVAAYNHNPVKFNKPHDRIGNARVTTIALRPDWRYLVRPAEIARRADPHCSPTWRPDPADEGAVKEQRSYFEPWPNFCDTRPQYKRAPRERGASCGSEYCTDPECVRAHRTAATKAHRDACNATYGYYAADRMSVFAGDLHGTGEERVDTETAPKGRVSRAKTTDPIVTRAVVPLTYLERVFALYFGASHVFRANDDRHAILSYFWIELMYGEGPIRERCIKAWNRANHYARKERYARK